MVNYLSKRGDAYKKWQNFLDVAVNWGLKTLLGAIVGLQIVRNMVSPVMDAMKRSAVGKAASAIPGIGNAVTAVTELVLTSAVMVRNSFGAVIVILLLLIWSRTDYPLWKSFSGLSFSGCDCTANF